MRTLLRLLILITLFVTLVLSCEGQGTQTGGSKSGTGTFSSTPTGDVAKPNLSSISSGTPTQTEATITFTSNEVAEVQICRGPTGGPYTTACIPAAYASSFDTRHSRTFTGLSASTAYFYVVKARDAAGNERVCNTDGTGGGACPSAVELTFTTASGAAGVPPYGSISTVAITPHNHSAQVPYPVASTISTGTCASNICTINTTDVHALTTGDFVQITGTSTDADVSNATITDCARTSPSTTVTCNTSATVTFPAGARVFLEGANLAHIWGAFNTATASGTQFTFVSLETTTRSLTTGTAVYSVAVTVTDTDTFTYTKTGATGSPAAGTVTPVRMLPPVQGGTYTDTTIANAAPVTMLMWGSSGDDTACTNPRLGNFHSTDSPIDAGGTLIKFFCTSNGPFIYNLSTKAYVGNIGVGGGGNAKWDRNTAKKMWIRSGTQLKSIADVTVSMTSTLVYDFSADGCTEIGLAGPGSGDEGPGTTIGGRIAIVCKKSASPEIWDVYIWNITSVAIEYSIAGSVNGTGNIDWAHAIDTSGGALKGVLIRWVNSGPDNCTASYSDPTITFTCASSFAHVVDGEKFRTFTCSTGAYNRLWTVVSHTNTTLVATQAGLGGSSATSCRVGTQSRGLAFWKPSGATMVFNNNLRWVGQHGMGGVDIAGHPVWVGGGNVLVQTYNVCPTYSDGAIMIEADTANGWTDGASTYTGAALCLEDYLPAALGGGGDNNTSIAANGWATTSNRATGTTNVNAVDTIQPSTWSSNWRAFEAEIVANKLVEPGAANVRYRLARQFWAANGATPYPAFSLNNRYIVWNCNLRYANTSDYGAICMIDLGVW